MILILKNKRRCTHMFYIVDYKNKYDVKVRKMMYNAPDKNSIFKHFNETYGDVTIVAIEEAVQTYVSIDSDGKIIDAVHNGIISKGRWDINVLSNKLLL